MSSTDFQTTVLLIIIHLLLISDTPFSFGGKSFHNLTYMYCTYAIYVCVFSYYCVGLNFHTYNDVYFCIHYQGR